jgi:hypothetical protein
MSNKRPLNGRSSGCPQIGLVGCHGYSNMTEMELAQEALAEDEKAISARLLKLHPHGPGTENSYYSKSLGYHG